MVEQEKGKILVVDDEKDVVEMLAYHFEKRGYQTLKAFDGQEAWEKIELEIPDLLILDLMMPRLDGWELCRLIRCSYKEPIKQIAILMLTARAMTEDKIFGLKLGADDYLTKPFSINELILRAEKLMEKRGSMARLQKEVNRLLSTLEAKEWSLKQIAHDLKSPLISIGFSAKRMLRKDQNEDTSKTLKTIFESSLHLTQWIDEAFFSYPLTESTWQDQKKEVEVKSLLQHVLDLLKEMASEKNIEIQFHAFPPSLKAPLHEPLMKRALLNLLTNALKYTPRGGKIEIILKHYFNKRGTGVLEISVKDSGIGIPEDELESIFDPYYRGKNTTHGEGKGIGLSFVKKVIDLHGGRILVQSELNKGSIFSILLPIQSPSVEEKQELSSEEASIPKP